MKQGIVKGVIAGAIGVMLISSSIALAGQGRGAGKGPAYQNQRQAMEQIMQQKCFDRRYRAVEQGDMSGSGIRRGHALGPGDGTGNDGIGPKDGTGYGAPVQR